MRNGRIYFTKRAGWRWEVWFRYDDSRDNPRTGAREWRAVHGVRFWSKLTAERVGLALAIAHADGLASEP